MYLKNIGAEFTHLYIPSLCKQFFMMRHNLGHSNKHTCGREYSEREYSKVSNRKGGPFIDFFCYSKRGSPFISVSSSIWHFKSKKTSYQYLISNLSFCLQLSSLTHIRALIISSRVVLIVISLNSVRLNKIYQTGRPGARKQWPYRECVRNLDLRVQVHPGELWISKQQVHIVL